MQTDGVMMGSPLGALFANIFMFELKKHYYSITWRQSSPMETLCRRYICFNQTKHRTRNPACLEFISRDSFTYELEQDNKISFLDVLITQKNDGNMETGVYREPTHTDVYLNWNAHAPVSYTHLTLPTILLV